MLGRATEAASAATLWLTTSSVSTAYNRSSSVPMAVTLPAQSTGKPVPPGRQKGNLGAPSLQVGGDPALVGQLRDGEHSESDVAVSVPGALFELPCQTGPWRR